ncbi:MAG: sigma 54-interacting transcriptional regulator [Pseudodesulfovibrio sp.]|uniref:sigma-54-dependent Fis family transcriptional regulator n=1 Tax=Pseudodesulfovibrio sp. TaxID=2035812 RepID=UPI003D0EB533
MNVDQTFHFGNRRIQSLLLAMVGQRSTDALFSLIVDRLSSFEDVSLARIWLIKEGDVCDACLMAGECPSRELCLHLVASAGRSSRQGGRDWGRMDGTFRRFPMGVRKVGHIAATGQPVVVESIPDDPTWIAHPEWARAEGIVGFAGQPMRLHGEILGVLAVFTRSRVTQTSLDILSIIANHAATALANARAFEQIEALKSQLEAENSYLREELNEAGSYGGFIGRSLALRRIIQQIDLVAPTDANVLIQGESGTGKELVARELHQRSRRRSGRPLIKVNCASVPKELFASEFFGHVKGAFTGAHASREGKFGAADRGTLFLDEVGEIPLELQAQLLRVLQEGEYERVGEEKVRAVDARIIAATNRNLQKEVEAGRFREDLYFRLNVFPITVPSLRSRPEDIAPLAEHFLKRSLAAMNRPALRFSQAQIAQLEGYDWPGNVRELQNIVERFAITSAAGPAQVELFAHAGEEAGPCSPAAGDPLPLTEAELVRLQADNIEKALARCGGKIYGADGAAALLGVKPTTLATRIRKFGIRR